MEEPKESFKSHTDKKISEIQEIARRFKEDKIKEKMRKKSETHRKKEKVRGRKKYERNYQMVQPKKRVWIHPRG